MGGQPPAPRISVENEPPGLTRSDWFSSFAPAAPLPFLVDPAGSQESIETPQGRRGPGGFTDGPGGALGLS